MSASGGSTGGRVRGPVRMSKRETFGARESDREQVGTPPPKDSLPLGMDLANVGRMQNSKAVSGGGSPSTPSRASARNCPRSRRLEELFALACREGVRQPRLDPETVTFLRGLSRRLGLSRPRAHQILKRTIELRKAGRVRGTRPFSPARVAKKAQGLSLRHDQEGRPDPESLAVFLRALERCAPPGKPRSFEEYDLAPPATSSTRGGSKPGGSGGFRRISEWQSLPNFAGGVAAGALSIWIPFLLLRGILG